jgi:glycine/serine hydroxymethyltransferase
MEIIASLIDVTLTERNNPQTLEMVRKEVQKLCVQFPLYPEIGIKV